MTTQKAVGDAIAAAVMIKHRGAAQSIKVYWFLLPANKTTGYIQRGAAEYNILQSPNDGWEDLDLGTFDSTYPILDYTAGDENADSVIEVQDLQGVEILSIKYEDVYSLYVAPPTIPEFKDLSATFS